jgi:hypothetical protein
MEDFALNDFYSYRLYEQGAGQSRRIVELITRAKGERMVRSKTAVEGLDWDGETLCFVRIGTSSVNAVPTFGLGVNWVPADAEPEIERSSTAFSKPEVMALAGTRFRHGRSLTARMTEEQRKNRKDRRGKQLGPEDIVERATNKAKAWSQIPVLLDRVREVAGL